MPKKKKAAGGGGASGDPAKGEKIFKNLCAVCHSLSSHGTGPALGGIGGSNIAAGEGFSYSSALSSKATLKWTAGNLNRWLTAPSKFAPGNAMAFAGLPSAGDRGDLIAYLSA